jgi:hypothetical protein
MKVKGIVAGWICPECQRQFGRRNQSHECTPGMSLDDYFAGQQTLERAIYDAITEHLEAVGDVHVEAVRVGIFFKRARTFAELRPMRDRVRLWLLVSRPLEPNPRIVRNDRASGSRFAYSVDLRAASDVDDELRDWLTEAYFASPD